MIAAASIGIAYAVSPKNWQCRTVDATGNKQDFVAVTSEGSPVFAEGDAYFIKGAKQSIALPQKEKSLETHRLYFDSGDKRYSLTMPSGDPVTKTALVRVDENTGSSWPFSRTVLRGVCRFSGDRSEGVRTPQSETFKLDQTGNKQIIALNAKWKSDCWLVSPELEVLHFSAEVVLGGSMRINVPTEKSSRWPLGPVTMKGSALGFEENFSGESRSLVIFFAGTSGKIGDQKIEMDSLLTVVELGATHSIIGWIKAGGVKKRLGVGLCEPSKFHWTSK